MASEPVAMPTTPLARVRPAEAAIEVSATLSLTFGIGKEPLAASGSGATGARQCGGRASVALVRGDILRHASANDLHLGHASVAPLRGGADDGVDRPALPVLPSSAHAPDPDLYRDDHDRRGAARRPRAPP